MYEAYFGLSEHPFSLSPNPRYLYHSPRHREALAHLSYGIQQRGGFVQLTGEVGTGKTLLTRALLEELPGNVELALMLQPRLSPLEFLAALCRELDIPLPERRHSIQALVSALHEYLLENYARGRRTVLLVDEAQNLSPQVIEQVRLLTNLETHQEKLLQILLVGQPELRELLARQDMRQVAQRITARYHLEPLSAAETRDYVRHRLAVAGVTRPLFGRSALWLLHRLSGGVPRLVNVIADRGLLGAYARNESLVSLGTLWRAAREVRGEWRKARLKPGLIVAAVVLALAAALSLPGLAPESQAPRAAPTASQAAIAAAPAAPATVPDTETPRRERATAPGLAETLNGAAAATGLERAFATVAERWGLAYPASAQGAPCEKAAQIGLRCSYLNADMNSALRLNLPMIIRLSDMRGRPHHLSIMGADGERIRLNLDGNELEIPRQLLRRVWPREHLVLWRAPAGIDGILRTGSRGEQVRWLRRQLDRLEGISSGSVPKEFDAALAERVRRFQRDNYLHIDGKVGENTLMHLLGAVAADDVPQLGGRH
ncbi:ExeA family protein [Alkalilimnicola sp. S0819]|uniref:ExeA family protein n=1 Tax=Alkalilimnicola sp. S0819 TaxID=2613922 RepID=UPI001262145E|nr:ExeA family protein [Alkalilimnicola sp. S0819]KAB7623712.1 AAA family ATPase [Alkalilimnicola sp. S0819]MPQ16841.1 AAA family ATPase [Alkalilimnicola sp. S0819]